MNSKVDMIIDVSKNLTEWWLNAKALGLGDDGSWFYRDNKDLYNQDMPATFDIVLEKANALDYGQSAFLLESISCGLFDLCLSEGVLSKECKK